MRLNNVFEFLLFATSIYVFYLSQVYRYDLSKHINIWKFQSVSDPMKVIEKSPDIKYVLILTSPTTIPIIDMGKGNETFCSRNCTVQNCYITRNRYLLTNNISSFDAIIFHGPEMLDHLPEFYLPKARPSNQIYIFASRESSHNYEVYDNRYDDIFNFTWSYKLDSDITFTNMIVKDQKGKVIGPDKTMPWLSINNMLPINIAIKEKLVDKSIAAAWFVTKCDSKSGREKIVELLSDELLKYNLIVDIYGNCAYSKYTLCPKISMEKCFKKLQRDYYFYLSFEDSFSNDYVTEQLLNALQNYAVPVVYGGADYKRFMPDGIYLDITNMSIEKIANEMATIIEDKARYNDLFKWHNHYTYHHPEDSSLTDPYCAFCNFTNNIDYTKVSRVENFYDWWDSPDRLNVV